MEDMRVAIFHYWLVSMRGGERVLESLLNLFPEADLYTHVYDPEKVSDKIRERNVQTTFIQKLPGARKHYQKYLPLMPMALESLDLRDYDLVISSESGPSKGVITSPDALHVCYCHSPMRYLWDHYHDYRAKAGPISRFLMRPLFHYLRIWDFASSVRVDKYVANSKFIRRRISRVWGHEAAVVHPPVATHLFQPANHISDRYLWVGQFTAYKKADLVIEAFNRLNLPITMVGTGELEESLKEKANPNIEFKPRMNFADLRRAYAECRALIFPTEEDFGIVPVEANASGRPVIAYGSGGATETIVPGKTGIFFKEQTAESLIDAIRTFENWLPNFYPHEAVQNAKRFSIEQFEKGFMREVEHAFAQFNEA